MYKVLTRARPCEQMLLDSAVKNINKAYISYFTLLNMLSNYYLIRIKWLYPHKIPYGVDMSEHFILML